MDFITIDVETANYNAGSICQIGLAKYMKGRLVDTFVSYVNPDDSFSQKNIEIHGITRDMVKDAPTIFDIYGNILKFVSDLPVVSHTNFDYKAISQCLTALNLPVPNWVWVDSSIMVRETCEKWAYSGYSLSNVCNEWGYSFSHHDALEDAKACGFIVKTILREQQQSINDWIDVKKLSSSKKSKAYPARTQARNGDTSGRFSGLSMCFTGELGMGRGEISDLAAKHGFDVKSGVSKKLNYLVIGVQDLTLLAGHEKSSKHRKAEDLVKEGLNIQIITEKEFLKIVEL